MTRAHLSLQATRSSSLPSLIHPGTPRLVHLERKYGLRTTVERLHQHGQDRTVRGTLGRVRPVALLGPAPAAFIKLVATSSDADLYHLLVVDGDNRTEQLTIPSLTWSSLCLTMLSEEFLSFLLLLRPTRGPTT
jgi:hypothetical protein